MPQPSLVSPFIEAAFQAARAKYPQPNQDWVHLSARLAGRVSLAPLMLNMQRAGDLDLLLRAMEDEAVSTMAAPVQGFGMAFHYQMMFSEIWVIAAYEALRALRQREFESSKVTGADESRVQSDTVSRLPAFKEVFKDLELLRMPMAKYEIADERAMKQPLNMRAIPPNGDATDDKVYDKEDPARVHIMPAGLTPRGSVAWHALDHKTKREYRIERRDLADRLLRLKDDIEPAGLREARLAADKGNNALA